MISKATFWVVVEHCVMALFDFRYAVRAILVKDLSISWHSTRMESVFLI